MATPNYKYRDALRTPSPKPDYGHSSSIGTRYRPISPGSQKPQPYEPHKTGTYDNVIDHEYVSNFRQGSAAPAGYVTNAFNHYPTYDSTYRQGSAAPASYVQHAFGTESGYAANLRQGSAAPAGYTTNAFGNNSGHAANYRQGSAAPAGYVMDASSNSPVYSANIRQGSAAPAGYAVDAFGQSYPYPYSASARPYVPTPTAGMLPYPEDSNVYGMESTPASDFDIIFFNRSSSKDIAQAKPAVSFNVNGGQTGVPNPSMLFRREDYHDVLHTQLSSLPLQVNCLTSVKGKDFYARLLASKEPAREIGRNIDHLRHSLRTAKSTFSATRFNPYHTFKDVYGYAKASRSVLHALAWTGAGEAEKTLTLDLFIRLDSIFWELEMILGLGTQADKNPRLAASRDPEYSGGG